MQTDRSPFDNFPVRLHLAFDQTAIKPGRSRTTEVATRFGVSRETVRLWFSGAAMPELSRLVEIADFCGVNIDWLARNRGDMRHRPLNAVAETHAAYGSMLSSDEHLVVHAMRSMDERRRHGLVELLR